MNSVCHREAVEAIEILPKQVKDIGELCDTSVSIKRRLLTEQCLSKFCKTFAYYLAKDLLLEAMAVE